MRIFGKTVGDYLRFAAGVVALVVVVGVARLALDLGGVPVSSVRFVQTESVQTSRVQSMPSSQSAPDSQGIGGTLASSVPAS